MALKSTIHRATVELSHVDRGVYETLQTTLARHPSETVERLVVRLLAHALCFEPGLEFGRGVSTSDEPDVWSRDGDGHVLHWIDVGRPDAGRLVKASRRSDRITVFAYGGGLDRWWDAQAPQLQALANLAVHRIDDAFVAALVAALDRNIRWALTVSEGAIYLEVAGRSLDATPQLLLDTRDR